MPFGFNDQLCVSRSLVTVGGRHYIAKGHYRPRVYGEWAGQGGTDILIVKQSEAGEVTPIMTFVWMLILHCGIALGYLSILACVMRLGDITCEIAEDQSTEEDLRKRATRKRRFTTTLILFALSAVLGGVAFSILY